MGLVLGMEGKTVATSTPAHTKYVQKYGKPSEDHWLDISYLMQSKGAKNFSELLKTFQTTPVTPPSSPNLHHRPENQDLQNQLWEAKKNSQKKQFGVDQWERAFKKLHSENKRVRCELQHANKELEKPIRTHKECREKSEALENSNIQLT